MTDIIRERRALCATMFGDWTYHNIAWARLVNEILYLYNPSRKIVIAIHNFEVAEAINLEVIGSYTIDYKIFLETDRALNISSRSLHL